MFTLRSGILTVLAVALATSLLNAQQAPATNDDSAKNLAFESTTTTQTAPAESGSQDADKTAKAATTDEANGRQAKDRKTHVHLGPVSVGASYTHVSGSPYYGSPYYGYPYWDGPYSYYAWSPFWGASPFYGPGYFSRNDGRGEVKLSTEAKKAAVYVDGGYAGTADQLKSMWLDPGAYDLSLTADGKSFQQRIYVLSGKTLKITARLEAPASEGKP